MKLRKIIFSCGLAVSVLICASTVLAIDWYSSSWTIPNNNHEPTRTRVRLATGHIHWTKVTDVNDQDCTISSAIYKGAWRCAGFDELTPGIDHAHDTNGGVRVDDIIQAAFKSDNFWYDVEATIHWAP